ncbi:hypothetical protein Tco_0759821 [Tanacetum coccineum]
MVINSNSLTDKKELAIPGQTTTGKEFSNPLMAACLEKSDENAEFHQIVDFRSTCSIDYTLTAVVISESLVRSDRLFNDEDGLKDLPEPFNDTYVTPCHTKKVFSNMARKSVNFSGNITPLFASMLVQNQAPEGEGGSDSVERAITTVASLDATIQGGDSVERALHYVTVSAPVSTVGVTISTAEPRTPPTTTTVFDNEDVTMEMAHTLIKMKEQKAKEKGVAITDVEDSSRIVKPVRSITTLQPLLTIDPKDKDKDLAQRLHEEELSELERAQQERQRQEDDTNAALAKEFDEIQVRIDVDYELAKVDSSSKTAGGSRKKTLAEKRAGEIKEQESAKKQKLEDVAEEQESQRVMKKQLQTRKHEKEELRMWLTVVSDEEETVDLKILSAKYPIVDWESHNLGNVDMEDLHTRFVDLHRLVMKRFEDITPEGYNLLLWGDLKVMFEPNAEDEIWSNQQDWTLISWKLYESCGVHTLLMDGTLTSFNMLVEKRYPLIKEMLQKMLNWKLKAEAESTMAFKLLKFIKSQLEE